jgi:mono/diheme cytochrome c family protein
MFDRGVRRMKRAACAFALLAACGGEPARGPVYPPGPAGDLARYAGEAATRRSALEASLVKRDNGYALLRLERYNEFAWGALAEWNPPAGRMHVGESAPRPSALAPLDVESVPWEWEALRALGERAFFVYPTQLAPNIARNAGTRAEADDLGLWEADGALGAAWAALPDGRVDSAFTCATCHASFAGGALSAGRNNERLAVGRASGDAAWPRGTADVTADASDNPVAITDLRPVRYQLNLHHAATLKNDLVALAIRIETLIITSMNQSVRPPRKLSAALAVYLTSLAPERAPEPELPGRAIFQRECARCHGDRGGSGAAVELEIVGTDPAVGRSSERGTGKYRVPALHHVGDRKRLLASGAVEDVAELLSPSRAAAGHRYGLDLGDADRDALLAYLRAL